LKLASAIAGKSPSVRPGCGGVGRGHVRHRRCAISCVATSGMRYYIVFQPLERERSYETGCLTSVGALRWPRAWRVQWASVKKTTRATPRCGGWGGAPHSRLRYDAQRTIQTRGSRLSFLEHERAQSRVPATYGTALGARVPLRSGRVCGAMSSRRSVGDVGEASRQTWPRCRC